MNFFEIEKNLEIVNDTYTNKRADNKSTDISLEEEIENSFVFIPKMNHYRIKK